jgi:pyruvate formate lyase activating enzyme
VPQREALYWEPDEDRVLCRLCPWHCRLAEGKVGRCGVRTHEAGSLVTSNYAEVTSLALDPIEKKPLYHFHPGASILSLGTFGCNLSCSFCQNWQISQQRPATQELLPEQAVALAQEAVAQGNIGLAYTYNEPFIWYEYLHDTAPLIREAGLLNVLVTNGVVEPEPLDALLPYIDAMNVDIKSMRETFYLKHCKGQGLPARRTVELAWGRTHVEITNLLIPGENDSWEDIRALVDWAASVSPSLPLHFSAYHPDYQFAAPATPRETLREAWEMAREKLEHVYVGNVMIDGATDTYCPNCGDRMVARRNYSVGTSGMDSKGRCAACGAEANLRV